MATHSSILAWEIPCTEEPSGPRSMESQKARYDRARMPHPYNIELINVINIIIMHISYIIYTNIIAI